MSSKIFVTKYQKADEWRLFLFVGVIGPHVTFTLLFVGVAVMG